MAVKLPPDHSYCDLNLHFHLTSLFQPYILNFTSLK